MIRHENVILLRSRMTSGTASGNSGRLSRIMSDDGAELAALVARMAQGDENAMALFYDRTVNRCYGLAYRIVRDAGIAEDVTAETYLQAWLQARGYIAGRGSTVAWLLTMCRSRAIDHLRSSRRQALTLASAVECPGTSDHDDPSALLVAMEASNQLREALESLGEMPRQVLGLAFYRGLTHEEIAEFTGLPLGTVKSHIRRGQHRLRVALSERDAEPAAP